MFRWAGILAAIVAGFLPAAMATPSRADGPRRVASLNLCADQLLVMLLPPERVASVTMLAADPALSFVADRVGGTPVNHGGAEEILSGASDLVLSTRHGRTATTAILAASGLDVVEIDIPNDFDAIRAQVRAVAAALGAVDRGERLLRGMDDALRAANPPPGARPPTALVWQASGFTAGAGTLVDAVLQAAGFENFAAKAGLVGYGYLSLEAVVTGRPDLLIAPAKAPDRPSLSDMLLLHPALASLPRVEIPGALWACGGPFTAEAVTRLAAHRRAMEGG